MWKGGYAILKHINLAVTDSWHSVVVRIAQGAATDRIGQS